jgi:methionyl-tRNA formyltransferase
VRIIFFGASELGYDCCESLIKNGQIIAGIFTIPQEFKISYSPGKPVKNYLFKDFTELGKKYGIPTFTINGDIKDYYETIENLQPDFLLAIGWYYMLPKKIIALAKQGGGGIHASLLPKYRGNAPLVWQMINGEKKSGVSFFYFSDGVDDGDIINQQTFEISEDDTIKEVLEKTKTASLKALEVAMPKLAAGTNDRIPQDHSEATTFPKRSPEDGLINWEWTPAKIKNFIRAQTKPYPGAFTYINDKKVIIWNADVLNKDCE